MIVDFDALRRDGMFAVHAALLALETAVEKQGRMTASLCAAVGYQDERRQDDRAIRNEIDDRLRVVEEQSANMGAALRQAQVELATLHRDVAELTHDTQVDLGILQTRIDAPKCALCRTADATTGPAGLLLFCADCHADVRAGIDDARIAWGRRVCRPGYRPRHPVDDVGGYCAACGTVTLGVSALEACGNCGGQDLRVVTSVRNDQALPQLPVVWTREALRAGLNADNGAGRE